MRSTVPALSALVLLFAGCIAPVADLTLGDVAAAPSRYLFACGGAASETPCETTVSDLRASYQEPYVAADPLRPGVFAIGMNVGPSPVDQALDAPEGRTARCQNDLLVTEDGGASWRYVETPRPATRPGTLPVYCGGDPALAFDAAGTLHHTGIATRDTYTGGFEIYYVKSPDLGATWSEPVVLSEGANEDRNWIAIDGAGRVYVTWQHFNGKGGSALAVSEDGGDSWTTFLPKSLERCFTVSPIVFDGEDALLACAAYAEAEPHARVVVYHPMNATFETRSVVSTDAFWPKLAWAGRTLLLFAESSGGALLATSSDAGRSWSPLSDATPLAGEAASGAAADVQWIATDAWGRAHVIWRVTAGDAATVESSFAYGVLGEGGIPVQDAVAIGRPERATQPEAPSTLGQRLGNHYMGLAFNEARGLVAWSDRGVLSVAFVEPA